MRPKATEVLEAHRRREALANTACARSAASTYSTPKRASRSRCSTITVPSAGSASSRFSFPREPFHPEPTSATVAVRRGDSMPCLNHFQAVW